MSAGRLILFFLWFAAIKALTNAASLAMQGFVSSPAWLRVCTNAGLGASGNALVQRTHHTLHVVDHHLTEA